MSSLWKIAPGQNRQPQTEDKTSAFGRKATDSSLRSATLRPAARGKLEECEVVGRELVGAGRHTPTMLRLYPEGYLCPMQHGPAVQEFHDAGLDHRRSIVREYDRRDNHVAAVIDDD